VTGRLHPNPSGYGKGRSHLGLKEKKGNPAGAGRNGLAWCRGWVYLGPLLGRVYPGPLLGRVHPDPILTKLGR